MSKTKLGDTPYFTPFDFQEYMDLEREVIAERAKPSAICLGGDALFQTDCCLNGLSELQIFAVRALIASFPAQDAELAEQAAR